jgi:hypothetical protein
MSRLALELLNLDLDETDVEVLTRLTIEPLSLSSSGVLSLEAIH